MVRAQVFDRARIRVLLAVSVVGVTALSPRVDAASINKAANTNDLGSGSSWVGGIAPTAADIAVFNAGQGANTAFTAAGSLTWQGIKLTDAVPGTSISGAGLQIGLAGIDLTQASGVGQSLSLNTSSVGLTANQIWDTGTTSSLLSLGGGTGLDLGQFTGGGTLTVQGSAGTVSLQGAVSNGALIKSGTGTLSLGAFNSFSGTGVTLNAGRLNLANAGALGSSSPMTINGGSVDNTSGLDIDLSIIGLTPLTIGGGFTYVGTNALNMGAGSITLGANASINVSASTLTLGGAMSTASTSSTFTLAKNGAGWLVLGGATASAYSGGVTLNQGFLAGASNTAFGTGTLTLAGGTLTMASNAARIYANPIRVTGLATILPTHPTEATFFNNITLNGNLSGNGTLVLSIPTPGFGVVFGGAANQASGFTGTIQVFNPVDNSTQSGFISITGGNDKNFGNAIIDFGTKQTMTLIRPNANTTTTIGALTGGVVPVQGLFNGSFQVASQLRGSTAANGVATYVVGSLNTSTTFSGEFVNGSGTNSVTNLTKTGTGTLTIQSGTNQQYTGIATITNGALGITNLSDGAVSVNGTWVNSDINTNGAMTVASLVGLSVGMNLTPTAVAYRSDLKIVAIDPTTNTIYTNFGTDAGAGTATPVNFYVASGLGGSLPAAANLVFGGGTTTGTLRYTGGAGSTNRLFTILGGATLDSSGGGPMNFTNSGAIALGTAGTARTLTLTGTNAGGTNTFNPSLADNGAGAVSVLKNGANTWALTGALTYTGVTTVNTGTLQIRGGTLASSITVAGGAHLAPGADSINSGVGTVALSGNAGLTLNNTAVLDIESTGSNTDRVSLTTGTMTLNTAATVNFFKAGSGAAFNYNGDYTIASFAAGKLVGATFSGQQITNLTPGNAGGGLTYQFFLDNSSTSIFVRVAGGAALPIWTGASGTDWGTGGDWLGGVVPGGQGEIVSLGTSGGANTAVVLNAPRHVGVLGLDNSNSYTVSAGGGGGKLFLDNGSGAASIVMSNSAQAQSHSITADVELDSPTAITFNNTGHTLTLSGVISNGSNSAAATAVTVSGPGRLILTGANTFAGVLTIGANTQVQVGSGGATGTLGAGPVILNGSLTINRTGAVSIANNLSGAGAFTQAGTSNTTLAGTANSMTGPTTVSGGTLTIGSGSSIGTGALTVTSPAKLDLGGSTTTVASLSGSGNIDNSSAAPASLTFGSNGTSTTFSGVLQNTGANIRLTKVGTGKTTFTGVNTFAGTVRIDGAAAGGQILINSAPANVFGTAIEVNAANATNSGLALGSGVSLSTPITILTGAGGNGSNWIDVPVGNATLSGAIAVGPGVLIRTGITGTGSLTITGMITVDSAATANPMTTGGNIIFAGSGGWVNNTNTSVFIGRPPTVAQQNILPPNVTTFKDNSVLSSIGLTVADTEAIAIGGSANNANHSVTMNIRDNAVVTAGSQGSGRVSINGSASAAPATVVTTVLNLDGGSLLLSRFTKINNGAGSNSTINFNGTVVIVGSSTPNFLDASSSLATIIGAGGAKLNTNGFGGPNAITISSQLRSSPGDGGVTMLDQGTLTLSHSANSYNGPTTINAGVLRLTGNLTGTGTVSVNSGATFGMAGSGVGGSVNVAGGGTWNVLGGTVGGSASLANGASANMVDNSVETLSVGSGMTFSTGSTLNLDLGGFSTVADKIAVAGPLTTAAGGTTINLNPIGLTPGQSYTILTHNGANDPTGAFILAANSTQFVLNTASIIYTPGAVSVSITGPALPTTAFWSGARGSPFWTALSGTLTNFNTTAASGLNTGQTPGPITDVVFGTTAPGATNLATDLGMTIAVKSITVSPGVTGVSIAGNNTNPSGTYSLLIGAGGITTGAGSGGIAISANVNLAQSQSWTNLDAAGTIAVGGIVSGPSNSSLTVVGTVALNSTNTYTGATTIAAGGTLTAGADNALGSTSGLAFTGAGVLQANGHVVGIGGLSGGASSIIENGGFVDGTLTVTSAASNTFGGVIRDGSSGTPMALIFDGGGTLTLTNINTSTGSNRVRNGKLILPAGSQITSANDANLGHNITVGDTANSVGIISVDGGTILSNCFPADGDGMVLGGGAGAVGILRMNSGTITTGNESEIWMGSGANSMGIMTINGGAVSVSAWLPIGRGKVANTACIGILNMNGGTLDEGFGNLTQALSVGSSQVVAGAGILGGIATFAGNSVTNAHNEIVVAEDGSGILTIKDSAIINIGSASLVGSLTLALNNRAILGIVNLDGGTLSTNRVTGGTAGGFPATRTGAILNFNGGLLKSNSTNSAATFLAGISSAFVFSGGARIDDGGNAITISQPLLTPTGSGITSITVSGGTGYLDTPALNITGGGGTGATGIVNVDTSTGLITSVTITNPGNGFTSTPVFTISGGGGSGATVSAFTTALNVSGGYTKLGSGTTTLSGANTFSGTTSITAGLLNLANSSALQNSILSSISGNLSFDVSVAANTFVIGGLTSNYNLLLQNNGTAPSAITLVVGNNTTATTYSGVLSGPGALTKVGAGSLTITGANTYAGATSINGGVLVVSNNGNLGNPASGGAVNISGGTLMTANTFALDNAGANKRNVVITGNGATFNLTGANTLTVSGVMSGNGPVTLNGAGSTLLVTGAASYTGQTNVSASTTVEFGGNATHSVGVINGLGTIQVDAGATLNSSLPPPTTLATFVVNGKGSFAANASLTNRTGRITNLTIAGAGPSAWTGLLNLRNNNLIITNGGTNVQSQIKQGANLGAWNGTGGITSSSAQAAATGSTATALGYATGTDYTAGNGLTSFDGQTFGGTDILVKYTLAGDANMDGSVTFADFLQLQNNYNQASTNWEKGDWNYDGSTTFADFLILQNNYNKVLAVGNVLPGGGGASSGAVPEPASLAVLAIGGAALLTRRRRR